MQLRSIELNLSGAKEAGEFLTHIWGAAPAGIVGETFYIRGSSALPYLVSLTEADTPAVRSITFNACALEIEAIVAKAAKSLRIVCDETVSSDPGGGHGILLQMPEGEVFRFLQGSETAEAMTGRDLPVKLTHIVMNSVDAENTGHYCEDILGFRVSDRTKGMVFVRCNNAHHSVAFARAGFASLNHIAFEMQDIDAVMRGMGRLRDAGLDPAWGPGRHGPGANVFAYYVAPFGAVVEFSTAVNLVSDDYPVGKPEDWTWPQNRIDQWGVSDKDLDSLGIAERRFCFQAASSG